MYVSSISLSNLSFDESLGRISGSVSMKINDEELTAHSVNAQFLCRVPGASSLAHAEQVIALAREALRQARRLPDYMSLCENDAFRHENITVAGG